MTDAVRITEVTLRDGLQIEATIVPTAAKIQFAKDLVSVGFTDLEVGSWVNPKAVPSMVVSASDSHSISNSGVPTAEALERIKATAAILQESAIPLEGCIATAFVCPFDGDTPIERVERVVNDYAEIGVNVIHLSDTIGAASPGDVQRVIKATVDVVPVERLSLHLHDTYGMASANAWEGYAQGIRRFDAALGGLGGCPFAPGATGNIATDDLIHMFHREGIPTGIDVAALVGLRTLLVSLVDHPLASSLARIPAAPSALRQIS
jgi:hydroxymethylglutaryl-CoA lyase